MPTGVYKRTEKTLIVLRERGKSFSGENHPMWKGGPPPCPSCGNKKSRRESKLCISCYKKSRFGENNNIWKGGKIEKSCLLCNKDFFVYVYREKTALFCSPRCTSKFKHPNGFFGGKKHKESSLKMMSDAKLGDKAPTWKGGVSKLPYPFEFDENLKEEIRKRDKYTCQSCGVTEEKHSIRHGRNLAIHHIDYNKSNCSKDNLTATCFSCNSKANFNRDYWIEFFSDKLCSRK
jgi:hypothetical protein